MSDYWDEQIQRLIDGQLSREEIAALQRALNEVHELRVLYFDYMNLDVALGAVADVAIAVENGSSEPVVYPRRNVRWAPHTWRWIAATTACAASVLFVTLFRQREVSQAQPDIAAVIASTRTSISLLRTDAPPLLPAWISPTASLLEQPSFPK